MKAIAPILNLFLIKHTWLIQQRRMESLYRRHIAPRI
jgi:hypothetical protein